MSHGRSCGMGVDQQMSRELPLHYRESCIDLESTSVSANSRIQCYQIELSLKDVEEEKRRLNEPVRLPFESGIEGEEGQRISENC